MRVMAVGATVGLAATWAAPSLHAGIVAMRDKSGQVVYVNTDDEEMRRAAARGGARGVEQLIEQRKKALPGIERYVERQSVDHGIDPDLVTALIRVESAWNPRAISRKGAVGLMQLMPATAARFGVRDLYNPRQNILGGIRYLRWLLDRFDNRVEWAVAAYNAGENAVETAHGIPPIPETQQYLERIRTLYPGLGPGSVLNSGRIYRIVDESGHVVFINE